MWIHPLTYHETYCAKYITGVTIYQSELHIAVVTL